MAETGILIVDLMDGAAKSCCNIKETAEVRKRNEDFRKKQLALQEAEEGYKEIHPRKTTVFRVFTALLGVCVCFGDIIGDCLAVVSLKGVRHAPMKENCSSTGNDIYGHNTFPLSCFTDSKPVGYVGMYIVLLLLSSILFCFELYGFQWSLRSHRQDETDPKDVINRALFAIITKLIVENFGLNLIRLAYGVNQAPDPIETVNFIVVSGAISVITMPLKLLNLMLFYQEVRRVYHWKSPILIKLKGPYWRCVPNVTGADIANHDAHKGKSKVPIQQTVVKSFNDRILRLVLIVLCVLSFIFAVATVLAVPMDNRLRTAV